MRDVVELGKKLSGYHGTVRGKLLLLQNKVLSLQEYILYESSIELADWDKTKTTYGTFDLTQDEIEYLIGRSKGFVSRYSKQLYELGFWKLLPNGRIKVIGFELIEISIIARLVDKYGIVDVQKFIAELQSPSAELQQNIAKLQPKSSKEEGVNQPQKVADLQQASPKSDFLSSKDNSLSHSSKQEITKLSVSSEQLDEDYQKIIEEGNYKGLTADDLKWIHDNIPFNSKR